MKQFVLHTGLPKTGTTSLRKHLFAHHPDIKYLGKNPHGKNQQYRYCVSEESHAMLCPFLWPADAKTVKPELTGLSLRAYYEGDDSDKTLVASWEGLGFMRAKPFELMLSRLVAAVPDARLLICLRHPASWIESWYLQRLGGHFENGRASEQFSNQPYLPIEDWLDRTISQRGDGVKGLLGHAQNIRTAARLLGQKRVGVLLFEQLCADPDAHYRKLASFLNIEVEQTLRLTAKKHSNKGLTRVQLEYIQATQESSTRRSQWRAMSQNNIAQRMKSLRLEHPDAAKAKVSLDRSVRERIENELRSDYAWLEQHMGVKLGHYGYPV